MFNLLMYNCDWSSKVIKVPNGRMFEFTEKHIIEQFQEDSRPLLDELIKLPCIFCQEGIDGETAYVGQINRYHIVKYDLSLEISFDTAVPPLKNNIIYANRLEMHMPEDFEFSRNHWAVKDVDLYRFLIRNVRPSRQRPTVFNISEFESVDQNTISVMMPFDSGFSLIYDAISDAVQQAGLQCIRADDIWEEASIIQDIVKLIDRSRIVVCDCTGRNPNVFYEAGIAHALGREVVLITQSKDDIPFDLRHLRYLCYLNNTEGRGKLTQELLSRIKTLLLS